MLKKKFLNFNYLVNFSIHLGKNVHNRATWIQNYVKFSRGAWEALNLRETLWIFFRLESLIVNVIKKGGTLLFVGDWRSLFDQIFELIFGELNHKYFHIINYYSGEWPKKGLSTKVHLKYLNLRNLPTIIFIYDFKYKNLLLNEAYYLRIPVIGLVDNELHYNKILNRITIPIPHSNNIKSISFFFYFMKFLINKGIFYLNFKYNYLRSKNIYSSKILQKNLIYKTLNFNKKNWLCKYYIKDIFNLKHFSYTILKPEFVQLGTKNKDSVGYEAFSSYEFLKRSSRRRDSQFITKNYVSNKYFLGSLIKLWGRVRNTLNIGDEMFSRYFKYSYYLRFQESKKVYKTAVWFVKKLKKKEAYELREEKRREKKNEKIKASYKKKIIFF